MSFNAQKEWNERENAVGSINSNGNRLCVGYSNFGTPTHNYHTGISCSVIVKLEKDQEVFVHFEHRMRCENAFCTFTAAMIQPIYE